MKKKPFFLGETVRFQTIATTVLALIFSIAAFGKSILNLGNPFSIGDGIESYAGYNSNGLLGEISPHFAYPFGQDWRYFPSTSLIQSNLAHTISWITRNNFIGFNLVFILTFPLCSLLVLKTLRTFGVQSWINVPLALGFTAVPFHFYRLEHQELSTLYSLPLGMLLTALISVGVLEQGYKIKMKSNIGETGTSLGWILLGSVVLGWSGLYYSFFSMIMMGAAILFRATRSKNLKAWSRNLVPFLITGFMVLVALIPSLLIQMHGQKITFRRLTIESVIYSGQLIDSIVPTTISRVPGASFFAKALLPVNAWADTAGTIGVRWISDQGTVLTLFGAAILLVFAFGKSKFKISDTHKFIHAHTQEISKGEDNIQFIYILIFLTVLLLVPFGINELFATVISPQIRGWDRIIPLLQLLIIIGFGIVVEMYLLKNQKKKARVILIAVPLILIGTLYDSVLPASSYINDQFKFANEQKILASKVVSVVESQVGRNCAVLQLPYIHFPESAPLEKLGVYTPLWLPLVSKHNMWSYGGIYGSKQDVWVKAVSDNPIEFLSELKKRNFCAIEVATDGYKENDLAFLKEKFARQFGNPVTVDGPPKFLVYKI